MLVPTRQKDTRDTDRERPCKVAVSLGQSRMELYCSTYIFDVFDGIQKVLSITGDLALAVKHSQ